MDLIVIPGFQQEPDSSPLKELTNSLKSDFSTIKEIYWPQEKYDKESYEGEVIKKLENKSVILGHSLGASVGLSIISNPKVTGIIALDPINKAEDKEKNTLQIDNIDSSKPILVFDSGSEQINLPKGDYERKKLDSNHFFESSEQEIGNIAKKWVRQNV